MLAPPPAPALTTPYARYLARYADGQKGDLIHGRTVLQMSASTRHEDLQAFVLTLLRLYVSARHLGKVLGSRALVRIDDQNGFEPDVLFVAQARRAIIEAQEIVAAPDLVVEIVTASTRRQDRVEKLLGYERIGVGEYWLLDPEREEAAFYRRGADGLLADVALADGVFHSEAVPGFRLRVVDCWADPLPAEMDVLKTLLA